MFAHSEITSSHPEGHLTSSLRLPGSPRSGQFDANDEFSKLDVPRFERTQCVSQLQVEGGRAAYSVNTRRGVWGKQTGEKIQCHRIILIKNLRTEGDSSSY